jgi:hypothetical protein
MTLNPLNHKRLSSTSRMQSCLRNPTFHHRKYLNGANPRSATAAPQRQPAQIACLPSQHPGCFIAQGLLSPAPPKLLCRFFASCIQAVRPAPAPTEQVVAVAPRRRNLNPRQTHPGRLKPDRTSRPNSYPGTFKSFAASIPGTGYVTSKLRSFEVT